MLIPFVLKLASGRKVLYGNVAFSILALSTKKYFQKIYFKVKTIKISSDCHIKTSRVLKRKAILKIASTVFRVAFKMQTLKQSVVLCQVKNQLKFCCKNC